MPSPTARLLRFLALVCLLLFCYNSASFSWTQSRFQKFLAARYITWDDFPTKYADALFNKDYDGLRSNVFDYAHIFPRPTSTANNDTIPPIIHFIWFQNLYATRPEVTQIPSQGSDAPRLCAEHNPRSEVKIWNATASRQLLEEHYSWFLPLYDSYKYPIQRIDAIKYFVLWHYGGVYMDMDIACRRSLDPLLPFPAWFPEASPLGVNNDLMASRAGHPIIMMMIRNLKRRNRNLLFPYLTIFWSTGPQFTSDMLKRRFVEYEEGKRDSYAPSASKTHADPASFFVLPQVFYSEEYTFFGHSPGGTWHGDDVAVVLWFVAHPFTFWSLVTLVTGGCCGGIITYRRRKRRMEAMQPSKDLEA